MEAPGPLAFAREKGYPRRMKPNTRRRKETEIHTERKIGRDTKETEVPTEYNPPETDRDLGTGQGRQEGANGCGTRRRKQECGAGCRDERQRLVGGGWGEVHVDDVTRRERMWREGEREQ